EPPHPEAASVFIEPLRPGEPHTSQFIGNLGDPLTPFARERVTSEARQGRYEICEWVVCRDGVRSISKFAVERDNRVPATVKGQIAAQTQDAIANGAILGNKAQRPYLRVEYA